MTLCDAGSRIRRRPPPAARRRCHTPLVGETYRDAADSLALLLSLQDYRVSVAYSAAEAIHLVQVDAPDIVIAEVRLPDMDATELVRRLRRFLPHARLVALTATLNDGLQARAARTAARRLQRKVRPAVRLAGGECPPRE